MGILSNKFTKDPQKLGLQIIDYISKNRGDRLDIDKIKKLIARGADLNTDLVEKNPRSSILYTAIFCRVPAQAIKILIEAGADPNKEISNGSTALFWALKRGDFPTVQVLLDNNASVCKKDKQGFTPLMEAACSINIFDAPTLIEKLLKRGAQINDKNEFGRNALMDAALLGKTQAVEALIGHHSPLNEQDNEGRTALMLALERKYSDVAKILVTAGADVTLQDKAGKTALDYANLLDPDNIIGTLQKKTPPNKKPPDGGALFR